MKKNPEDRARMMRAFKSRDTAPEMAVRRVVYEMGYRYRLHWADLPGKPDLVFIGRRKVIFVHGCFWHSHGCCLTRLPKENLGYWVPKLARNSARDAKNLLNLQEEGWSSLVIWECEVPNERHLRSRLRAFLK